MNFADAMTNEMNHGKTWNGADCYTSTSNKCLDFFGRIGAMRTAPVSDKLDLFDEAYREDATAAMKLLFFARDIRGGYGERDAFNQIFAHLAKTHKESVIKNIPYVFEYGRADDLYSLMDTPAENAMWAFVKEQFEADKANLEKGKPVSLLAKWLATPNASSQKTAQLGRLTAKKLGYDFKSMSQYRKTLVALRKAIDIPEAKMSTGRWNEINYETVPSKCNIQNRKAFLKHDEDRYNEFISQVQSGEKKMQMGTANPCDIMQKVVKGDNSVEVNTMWSQLPKVASKALCVIDTSGSMTWDSSCAGGVYPMTVATALGIYFAQQNVGQFKDKFFTFSDNPSLIEIKGDTLGQMYSQILHSGNVGMSTNLEAVFDKILDMGIKYNIAQEDMPEAICVISDMQINSGCSYSVRNGIMSFTDVMKQRYERAGYRLPHVIYWNVNAKNATFHASMSDDAVSLVSGYSPNIMKQVMDNIGKTPMDVMNEILASERYKNIVA